MALEWARHHRRGFIPAGIGDGKTAIGLLAIREAGQPAVVFSTKAIVEETWGAEIELWGLPLSYAAVAGPKKKRERAIASRPDVLGVSFDNLQWYLEQRDPIRRPFCIIDESSFLKSPPSQSQRVKAMMKHTKRFERCYALTASIAPEGALGLWPQFACVTPERPLGMLGQYRGRYFDAVVHPTHTTWRIREGAIKEIAKVLRPWVFPRPKRAKGHFGIPEPRVVPIPLPWRKTGHREQYEKLAKAELNERGMFDLDEALFGDLFVQTPGVLQNKLRQLSSGFLYDHNVVSLFDWYPDKVEALRKLVERTAGEPLLVMTQYEQEMDQIKEAFPDAQIGRPKSLAAWNNRELPMLVLHPASAGHGLNLQAGSSHVHFYSLPWGWEHWEQSIGRLYRRGQTRQVTVSYFAREGTVEERMKRVLDMKEKRQDEIVEELTGAS